MKTSCEQCGCDFDAQGARGRSPRFCSNVCRQRAYRMRRARAAVPSVPAVMRDARRWVRAGGKRPLTVAGFGASSTNPATWSGFDDVQAGVGDGFGFMLGGGFGCYDLDYAVEDGRLLPWAREVVDAIPEPVLFTELSQSGRGVHVFVAAEESRGTKVPVGSGRVERYTFGRFIRFGTPMKL